MATGYRRAITNRFKTSRTDRARTRLNLKLPALCRCASEEALLLTCNPKCRALPSLLSALGLHCFKALLVSSTAPPVTMVLCTIGASGANFYKRATTHFAKPIFFEAFRWPW